MGAALEQIGLEIGPEAVGETGMSSSSQIEAELDDLGAGQELRLVDQDAVRAGASSAPPRPRARMSVRAS